MTRDEAIAKVRKLLALSQSSNVHEAALAAQRAQEILAKYDIEQGMLDLDEPATEESIGNNSLGTTTERKSVWKGVLADALCRVNACRCYWFNRRALGVRSTNLQVVGRASDVQKVRYMFDLLVAEVDRLARRDCQGQGKTYSNNYRFGMVDAIREKLREAMINAQAEAYTSARHGNAMALVKLDKVLAKIKQRDKDVQDYMAKVKLRNATSYQAHHDGNARLHGYRTGQREVSVGSRARAGLGAPKKRIKSP